MKHAPSFPTVRAFAKGELLGIVRDLAAFNQRMDPSLSPNRAMELAAGTCWRVYRQEWQELEKVALQPGAPEDAVTLYDEDATAPESIQAVLIALTGTRTLLLDGGDA